MRIIDWSSDVCSSDLEWKTGLRIARTQIALWEDFEDLADQAEPAVAWRALTEGLRDTDAVELLPPPRGLRAQLRPYQQAGFSWLAFLWRHRLGGILADDMGLGKTLQMLALVAHARAAGERRPFARQSVASGMRVPVRVDLGGRRIRKKKNHRNNTQ